MISTHTGFRELAHGYDVPLRFGGANTAAIGTDNVLAVAHDSQKLRVQVKKITAGGGMVAPILAQGDVGRKNLPSCCMSVKDNVP
ncbi:MAG: hypothetical protein WCJ30_03250 [Deltaproteobacteria bacterium]